MNRAARPPLPFWIVVTVFGAYAAAFLARTSFVVDGIRYFTLADDQMISMRYAENLARGYGLVWNPGGERIEGYTNFLWVVYMAVFHWLRVPRHAISLCIELSGAALLIVNLFLLRRVALAMGGSERVAAAAVTLTALYIPLDNWAFQGTEVSVLTVVVTAGTWLAIRAFDSDRVPWPLFLVLGASTLVRLDMVVFAAVAIGAVAASRPDVARRRALAGLGVMAAFLAAQTAFRLEYFGDALPNTYYLKVSGFPLLPKMTRGAIVAMQFLGQLIPLVVALWLWRRRTQSAARRPFDGRVAFAGAVFVAQLCYSVSVGGDAWEWWGGSNRFVAIAIPLLFACAAIPLVELWGSFPRLARSPIVSGVAIASLALLLDNVALTIPGDRLSGVRRMLLITKPFETESDERAVRAALALRRFTTADAVVGVTWAGAIPYFSERTSVDLLGKMDRRIAHAPMRRPAGRSVWTAFYPGHMKWDYDYSIGTLRPDVLQAPLWRLDDGPPPALPLLTRDYRTVTVVGDWYVRNGSKQVRWDALVAMTRDRADTPERTRRGA